MFGLGPIRAATFSAPDLTAVEVAYCVHLGYEVAERGTVSSALAEMWAAPLCARSPYLLLAPADGTNTYLRFVERPLTPGYRPLVSHGWNAAEIVVADVDTLASQLLDSPFEIIGEPQDLSMTDAIRAMQVIGPAGEVLYLTQIKRQLSAWKLPQQEHGVGRVFIAVVGGSDLAAMQVFYSQALGLEGAKPAESRISVLAKALGVDPETRYMISTITLDGESLLELDEMPEECGPRPCRQGDLPPGFAMLTVVGGDAEAQPVADAGLIYQSATGANIVRGSAGEWIEIVCGPH